MRARHCRMLSRARSKLRANRIERDNDRKSIDKLEERVRGLQFDLENDRTRLRDTESMLEGERHASRRLGADIDIKDREIELLTQIVKREQLRVESECRVFTGLIEGSEPIANPTATERAIMRGMNG